MEVVCVKARISAEVVLNGLCPDALPVTRREYDIVTAGDAGYLSRISLPIVPGFEYHRLVNEQRQSIWIAVLVANVQAARQGRDLVFAVDGSQHSAIVVHLHDIAGVVGRKDHLPFPWLVGMFPTDQLGPRSGKTLC